MEAPLHESADGGGRGLSVVRCYSHEIVRSEGDAIWIDARLASFEDFHEFCSERVKIDVQIFARQEKTDFHLSKLPDLAVPIQRYFYAP
jgi:hypothetical protein